MLFLYCVVTAVIIYFLWKYRKMFFIRKIDGLPGPRTLPLIGSTYHLLLRNPDEILDFALEMKEEHSSPFQIWMGSKLFIGIYEPNQIKTILESKHCLNKSIVYDFIPPVFKRGLFTAPASMWTRIRRITRPIFHMNMLKSFFETFAERSIIFLNEIGETLGENETVLFQYLAYCTWIIACETMIGIQLTESKAKSYLEAVKRLKKIMKYRIRNMLLYPDFIFNLTTRGRKQKKFVNIIRSLTDEMIQQWKHENEQNIARNGNNRSQKSFFDILMEKSDGENFTQEEICDIVITMLMTASDTMAGAMNFVVFMMANYPEIQEKVYEELLNIYGTKSVKSAPIKYDDLKHMRYLECVIKETLRLFPVAPFIGREVTEDLKIGEFIVPKGSDIIIWFLALHRSEKYWENSLTFNPDRFLPKRFKNQDSYYPFSHGPRNCIGMNYGMIAMKVILATLIRTFFFKIKERIDISEIKLKFDLTLTTIEPLKMQVGKRYC